MFIQLTVSELVTLQIAIHHSINAHNEILSDGLSSSDYRKQEIQRLETIKSKLNGTESQHRLEATA